MNKILVLVLGCNTFLSCRHNAKENLNYYLALVRTVNPKQLLELHLYQSESMLPRAVQGFSGHLSIGLGRGLFHLTQAFCGGDV